MKGITVTLFSGGTTAAEKGSAAAIRGDAAGMSEAEADADKVLGATKKNVDQVKAKTLKSN